MTQEYTRGDLRPCPFCGSEPLYSEGMALFYNDQIRCPSCRCSMTHANPTTLRETWNKREGVGK